MRKKSTLQFLCMTAVWVMMYTQAHSAMCEEMVTNYQARVESLKKDLKSYKGKAPQPTIELIEGLIADVEGNIAQVSKMQTQGTDGAACSVLYKQVAGQIQQISAKISHLSNMEPFEGHDSEKAVGTPETAS